MSIKNYFSDTNIFTNRKSTKAINLKCGVGHYFNIDSGMAINGNIQYIKELNDFPDPVNSVITLIDNKLYVILNNLDLEGNRILCGENSCIYGLNSEISSLTSTGLNESTALITSTKTINLRDINIKDVGTALDLQASNTTDYVIDWRAVNFSNVPTIGIVKDYSNFIFESGSFLSSYGLTFKGTFGTIGFFNSFFRNNSGSETTIIFDNTLTITRRIKIFESSFITTSGGSSLNSSSTIPIQGYIVKECNFSGGSTTHIVGTQSDDDESLFRNNIGISNSREAGSFYIDTPSATTVSLNTWTKILGSTLQGNYNERFTHTNNRLTYIGAVTELMTIQFAVSMSGSNGDIIDVGISYNGSDPTDDTVVEQTMDSGGKINHISNSAVILMAENDYIEIWTKNKSSTNSVTANSLNLLVTS